MRRLCFGGSFNPVHHGHLLCARAVAEAVRCSRVTLIPSAQPPHKPPSADMAAPGHRLAMCQLAAAGQDDLFEVDDIELHRGGPSYTLDTVRQLRARGWTELDWLIGADMLNILPAWHRAMELMGEVRFLIMARPGWSFDWDSLPAEFRHLEQNVVPAPRIEISASDIRQRLAAGRSIAYLTPPSVIEYIEAHRLYRSGDPA